MSKGVVYIMKTAVPGLLKIGRTGLDEYKERMRRLEKDGYSNVTSLKRYIAIELEDYVDKERLIHEIFSKHRVGDTELFALEAELAMQLFLSFDGKILYPTNIDKEHEFDKVTAKRRQGPLFNFHSKGLADGDIVTFAPDKTITAIVAGPRDVEYRGKVTKLSPLTRELFEQKGTVNKSGAYQGAAHWKYDGAILKDMPDIIELY